MLDSGIDSASCQPKKRDYRYGNKYWGKITKRNKIVFAINAFDRFSGNEFYFFYYFFLGEDCDSTRRLRFISFFPLHSKCSIELPCLK